MNASKSESTPAYPEKRIEVKRLHEYVRAIWEKAGSTPREAELVADHLIAANLAGHDSHGIGMIPRYVDALGEGGLKLNGHVKVVKDFGAVLTLEGDAAFGQVMAYEAMELGIERARKLGIAAVGLRNSHHVGRIGHWAEQCAAAGFVSFHFVNVPGNVFVAPFGGMDSRFGTNPFCAAFPRPGKPPIVLDLATSGIAAGKVRVAYNKGVLVPPGNLIDHLGHPTQEPKVLFEEPMGSLTCFGGHKGAGIAYMCEILAGALSGGVTTHAATVKEDSAILNCIMSIIIKPEAFDAPDMQSEADAFVDWVKATRLAPGAGEILIPGEPERARRAERESLGIPVDPTTWKHIHDRALRVGMPADQVEAFTASLV